MIVAASYYKSGSGGVPPSPDDAYWRCLCGLAFTTRRLSGHTGPILLFTNDRPHSDFLAVLSRLGVELVDIPFTYRPPEGFFRTYNEAFYLLDALEWAASHLSPEETVLFLDPDCVVTGDLTALKSAMEQVGIVAMQVDYPPAKVTNGLSREEMRVMQSGFFDNPGGMIPPWIGGELLGFTGKALQQLAPELRRVWALNLAAFESGGLYYKTEEQVFSAIFSAKGIRYFDARRVFVERIWTAARFRNYSERVLALPVWHLPAEKHTGFRKLWGKIGAAKTSGQDRITARRLASLMSIRGPSIREFLFIGSRLLHLGRSSWRALTGRVANYD